MIAADAGPMQIQLWEGAVPRFAGTVCRAAGSEGGKSEVGAEFLRRDSWRKWKDEICRRTRRRETERAGTRKGFVL